MKFVLFCAFAATFAALAICAPSLSVSAHLLSADEVAMLESDETLSVEQSFIFCPLDFRTNGLSSLAAARKIHEQAMANAYCLISKAHTSIATTKYNHDVSLFKQNNQRTTWRTQAQVDQAKNVLDAAKADENRKCLCKTGGSTEADQKQASAVSGFSKSVIDVNYNKAALDYCPADYPTSHLKDDQAGRFTKYQVTTAQSFKNTDCKMSYTSLSMAQNSYNRYYERWSDPSKQGVGGWLKPSQAEMEHERKMLDNQIDATEKVCECKNAEQERTRMADSLKAVVAEQAKAQTQAVAEVKAASDSKDMAEAKAQADGYSSVQGKIDAWSKATTEARDAAKKAASTKAAEVAQRNAQATADANAKAAASSKASEQAKADAKTKAISQAKADAEAKAAAEAQAAADKAAADVWRTELATATITASSSATVTSAATATASGQGTASATESASGSAAVAKAGASETASVTESVTESKTATATATAEASATESATQSATATKTAPGTKVHFSANGLCDAKK